MPRFTRLALVLLTGCAFEPTTQSSRAQQLATQTVVSLTFDDTLANQLQVGAAVAARGMRATFYVNSGRIGLPARLTAEQLRALADQGNEIAGHTVSHADLPALDEDEARRQVCNDRVALLDLGFAVTSFAYPFGANNAQVQQIVDDCGYNSARGVGGIVSPGVCDGCPFAEVIPPAIPYDIKTPDSVKLETTLDDLKRYVTQAEDAGGGWVPLVFHHVCDGCDPLSVSPAILGEFLDWLAPRVGRDTVTRTVHEVIRGPVRRGVPGPPPPPPPPPPAGNLVHNPSLEVDANADQVPDCWQRGGTGSNVATFTLVSPGADGAVAQRIEITSFTSGARRLVTRQDLGSCAPPASPGRSYTMTGRYIANVQPRFTVYYRNASGGWVWFAQSPLLPVATSYTTGAYTTAPLPAGAQAVSFGLSIFGVGAITMDAFTLSEVAQVAAQTR